MTPVTIQNEPLVLEDLTKYRGSWVAIREGKVVASALGPSELKSRKEVLEGDEFLLVPDQTASTLFL